MPTEEKEQPIRSSDTTRACMARLVKAIEDWTYRESQRYGQELSSLAVTLSKNIIDFDAIRPGALRACKRIPLAIDTLMRHLESERNETDGKIDQMHVRFAQEIEELDLRIVRDRKEFRRYVDTVRHSEEFTDLQNAVSKINEQIQARMMAS